MDIYRWSEAELLAFILVLIRVSSFIMAWPVFSVQNLPQIAKILFALVLSIVIFPLVGWQKLPGGWQMELFIPFAIKEVCLGILLGFVTRMFFFAVSGAGEMVSVSMGLSNGQLFNPALNSSSTTVEQLKTIMATLLFLAFNGHHVFLKGLVMSYRALPLEQWNFSGMSLEQITSMGQGVLVASLQLSAPVVTAILLLNVGMGILGRVVPQINVLSLGFAVTLLGGFLALIATLPMFGQQVQIVFVQMTDYLFRSLKVV